jgi:AraC-like DNA-binding protein
MRHHRTPSHVRLAVRQHVDVLLETYEYSVGQVEPLQRHVHDAWQIAWSPNADGEHWVRGAVHRIPVRAIGIIPPGEVHAPSQEPLVDKPSAFMMAYVPTAFVSDVGSELGGRAIETPSFPALVVAGDRQGSRLFARAHRLGFNDEGLARDEAWLAFWVHLLTVYAKVRVDAVGTREPRAVRTAIELLRARASERITLTALAQSVDLSPARFCRSFTAHVGVPPHAYQLRCRIEQAKRLLLSGQSAADVASVTGFADQSHFTRHFKRIVGCPPAAYQGASR